MQRSLARRETKALGYVRCILEESCGEWHVETVKYFTSHPFLGSMLVSGCGNIPWHVVKLGSNTTSAVQKVPANKVSVSLFWSEVIRN